MGMPPLEKGERQDEDTIITLYDRYASAIFTYVSRRLANQQDAEDILLEVFIAALKTNVLDDLSTVQQLAWLRRVAHNKIVDRYRRQQASTALLPLQEALEAIDEGLTPEREIIRQEDYANLHRALEALPLKQQQVIQLRYSNNLRFKEIAALLQTTEGTVRKLLSRTLRSLRAAMLSTREER
ncbi:sigma-70 family RNA polymerase sigma factor [Ktedonosporobacter rubrisoli]|uniref:Sigma-70 family RNA polymerase sigma factor n=1 Tax=Ktedonosporobacter rubrisoli TaxID=2509675 RepID=A0A4P6JX97_KTERU|nr:sigma-70 family RNA polymerase sigma factor [Ktedonosporobacter rubrisoli]QBD79646.1 sigma-70 family RNA polymerase sigma factor [Ktedonosporobacter rubrisoli]